MLITSATIWISYTLICSFVRNLCRLGHDFTIVDGLKTFLLYAVTAIFLIYCCLPLTAITLQSLIGSSLGINFVYDQVQSLFYSSDIGKCKLDAESFCYDGEIDVQGLEKFQRIVENSEPSVQRLVIVSGGGDAQVAEKIADLIRRHVIKVIVPSRRREVACGSACVTLISLIPRDQLHVSPDATILFHVVRRGLLSSGRSLTPLNLWERYVDERVVEKVLVGLLDAPPMTDAERLEQTATADILEGKKDGRLKRSIEACPGQNPFTTPEGIRMRWSEIQRIIRSSGDVACPSPP